MMMDIDRKTTLARYRNLRISAIGEFVMVENVSDKSLSAPYQVACDMHELENGRDVYGMSADEVEWLNSFRINQLIQEWLR